MVGQHVLRPVRGAAGDPRRDRAGRDRSPSASSACRALCLACSPDSCFGLAGVTFQTMLRNPLASPDIIGISSGASAAAVFGIIVLGLGEHAGLGLRDRRGARRAALLIYVLSFAAASPAPG